MKVDSSPYPVQLSKATTRTHFQLVSKQQEHKPTTTKQEKDMRGKEDPGAQSSFLLM